MEDFLHSEGLLALKYQSAGSTIIITFPDLTGRHSREMPIFIWNYPPVQAILVAVKSTFPSCEFRRDSSVITREFRGKVDSIWGTVKPNGLSICKNEVPA